MSYRLTLCVACVLAFAVWAPQAHAAPLQAGSDGLRCQVATPVLRVRSAPNADQVGTAYGGTWLQAMARNTDQTWAKVNWSGHQAWVMTQYLRCDGALEDLTTADETPEADAAPAASPNASASSSSVSDDPAIPPLAQAMYDAVNAVRARFGLPAYSLDPRALDAAQWQADDMVARRYFAHNTPDGRRPADLMHDRGLPCPGWCGQNIIMGMTRDEIGYSIQWFMNSPVHRANLLSQRYSGIGIGVAQTSSGTRYYVLNFFGE